MAQNLDNGVIAAYDGSGFPIARTIDTRRQTGGSAYQSYEASATNTHDAFTDLGRMASAGFIENDDATNSLTVAFSVDGTNFGEEITVPAGKRFDFYVFLLFKEMRVTNASSVAYRSVVR